MKTRNHTSRQLANAVLRAYETIKAFLGLSDEVDQTVGGIDDIAIKEHTPRHARQEASTHRQSRPARTESHDSNKREHRDVVLTYLTAASEKHGNYY